MLQAKQQWLEEIGTEEGNDIYGSLVGDLDAVFASAIYNPIPEDDSNQSGGSTPASDRNFDRILSHASLGKTTSLQSNLTNSTCKTSYFRIEIVLSQKTPDSNVP